MGALAGRGVADVAVGGDLWRAAANAGLDGHPAECCFGRLAANGLRKGISVGVGRKDQELEIRKTKIILNDSF